MPANTSGFRHISLVFFLTLAVVLAACTRMQTAPPAQTPTLSSDPIVRWIEQHAVPLRTTDPGGSNADLASLHQVVGNASIVGLGEATHGTHEIIDIKARLTEFLISNMGFTTFIMENDWGSSHLLDAYINGGAGKLTEVMSQSLFGSWQTHEYQALFEWMRMYNATPSHTTKIHFLGMDCQDVSQSDFDAVENFLQGVDPQHVSTIQHLYAPIIAASLPNLSIYVSLPLSTKQRYQNQAQQVYDFLQAHQQVYVQHSSPQLYALALQNARILVQFATYYNADSQTVVNFDERDTFMAENVAWIHDHAAGSHPKIIVWAHDAHIANDTRYGTVNGRNMGGELRARYKDSYLPIGTTLYQGALRVYQYPKGVVQTISPPPASYTYNYTLGQSDLPLYMLDLRTIPLGPVRTWSQSSLSLVYYGLGDVYLSDSAPLDQWFDVIIHIQKTTPSNHL